MLKTERVIDLPVTVGSVERLASEVIQVARDGHGGYVCVANVHMVINARRDSNLRKVMEEAFLVTPDGLPLVWSLRQQGILEAKRVTGTDLTLELCQLAEKLQIPVGFYGSTIDTLSALKGQLSDQYPALKVVFYESPSELPLHPVVDLTVVDYINKSGAKIVFVGLGCPKQEFWMAAYAPHLSAVLIGVGAAFNFISGTVTRAPMWMQNMGFEWLHRLCMEPRKTWKRYATTNPVFIWLVIKEFFKAKAK